MSSLRTLKRKSLQKQKINKEEKILSKSWPSLCDHKETCLKRSKSESDIKSSDPPKVDVALHAKSSLELQSVYKFNKFTSSTPQSSPDNIMSSPESSYNAMQSSTFSVITDVDQIKIPIIGYEVMEERSRFTVSLKIVKKRIIFNIILFYRFSNFALKITKKITFGLYFEDSRISHVFTQN